MDVATMQTDRMAVLAPHRTATTITTQPAPRHHPRLPLRVGTRASPLALQQTRSFLTVLARVCPVLHQMDVFQEHVIRTTGDAVQDRRLAEIGGKGLFAKEIHEALMDGRIDLAVHSLKDLETTLPPGIVLACTLTREDVRDALIVSDCCEAIDAEDPYACLPEGAIIGTCSVRRQAQLLHARPDLRITMMRGNVHSRLDKIRHGDCAASLLAMAGLRRLGLEAEASVALSPRIMLPAACQGIVGITAREDATELCDLLKIVEDRAARVAATAERSLLGTLDGSCSTPIGAFGELLPDNRLRLSGLIASTDGTFLRRGEIEGGSADAARMGAELGTSLKAGAPAYVFA
jgi:hydroxymethylbilane synthase